MLFLNNLLTENSKMPCKKTDREADYKTTSRFYREVLEPSIKSNQKRAKITVNGVHVTSHSTVDVSCHHRDDITSLHVEHPACVQVTMVTPWTGWWLYHGNEVAVHTKVNSSSELVIELSVDVVPSRGGDSQFPSLYVIPPAMWLLGALTDQSLITRENNEEKNK